MIYFVATVIALTHGIAYDLSREDVFVAGKEEPPFASGYIGDVGYPDLIGGICCKLLIQVVGHHRQVMLRVRGCLVSLLLLAPDAVFSLDPFDPMNSY